MPERQIILAWNNLEAIEMPKLEGTLLRNQGVKMKWNMGVNLLRNQGVRLSGIFTIQVL